MRSNNPYAPPKARVSSISETSRVAGDYLLVLFYILPAISLLPYMVYRAISVQNWSALRYVVIFIPLILESAFFVGWYRRVAHQYRLKAMALIAMGQGLGVVIIFIMSAQIFVYCVSGVVPGFDKNDVVPTAIVWCGSSAWTFAMVFILGRRSRR